MCRIIGWMCVVVFFYLCASQTYLRTLFPVSQPPRPISSYTDMPRHDGKHTAILLGIERMNFVAIELTYGALSSPSARCSCQLLPFYIKKHTTCARRVWLRRGEAALVCARRSLAYSVAQKLMRNQLQNQDRSLLRP